MQRIIRNSLVFQILLFVPLLARAELVQGEVYAGASVGVPIYDKLDKTDVGYKLYGGYILYNYLGLDIAYLNLGNPSNNNVSKEVSGVNVAAMGYLPVNQQISLFAKLGSFVWDSKNSPDKNDSGNSISFSLGGDFNARDNVYIHGEIEKYEISNESIIMYSLGIMAAF